MLDATSQSIVNRIVAANRMCEGDLLALRRAIGADLVMDRAEADALFSLNAVSEKPDGWAPYFTSVLAAYVDDAQAPDGHVRGEPAHWLIERIDHDGVVETETELALLLNVIRTASYVPDVLTSYALSQVYSAVIDGRGVVAGQTLTPGVVGEAEVELLRRIIYAGSGCGSLRVSRPEAEMLMALNDETSGRDNHPSWQRLFVQALANHLMLAPVRRAMTAADAARMASAGPASLAARLNPKTAFRAWETARSMEKSHALNGVLGLLDAGASHAAESIVKTEADWLIARITRDGATNDNEAALLRYLRDECPDVHASLERMIAAA